MAEQQFVACAALYPGYLPTMMPNASCEPRHVQCGPAALNALFVFFCPET